MNVLDPLATGLLLAAGFTLLLVAQRRGWRPSLWVALATGLALRLGVLAAAAARGATQPEDFFQDFQIAGRAVLAGRDPLLAVPRNGWHFLPLPDYVLAGQYQLHLWLHVSWLVVGRLVPIACDLGLIVLVGRLATRDGRLRSFQYACNPVAIMVAALHGQLEPMALLTGVGALLLARRGRATLAGVLLGLSVAGNSWPVLLLPGLWASLSGLRARVIATVATLAVPLGLLATMPLAMGTRLADLPRVTRQVLGVRPVTGQWGWSGVLASVTGSGGHPLVSARLEAIGTALIAVAVLAAWARWRRADPVQLSAALLIVFLAVTARMGAQYLEWPMPLLAARPTRRTNLLIAVAAAWAGFGYLVVMALTGTAYLTATQVWVLASVPVVVALVVALPGRPGRPAEQPAGRPALWEAVRPAAAPVRLGLDTALDADPSGG